MPPYNTDNNPCLVRKTAASLNILKRERLKIGKLRLKQLLEAVGIQVRESKIVSMARIVFTSHHR